MMMKTLLFPALAGMLVFAAPSAFAELHGGTWFVLADANTHACFVDSRSASGGEQTLSGPYARKATALTVIEGIVECHGPYADLQPGSNSL
jgi:hypothetical protein